MTLKQKRFVKEYLKNGGDATNAALNVYDAKSIRNAGSLGWQNLQKPAVQEAIELALHKAGMGDDYIAETLKKSIDSGIGVKAKNADSLKGLDMLLKAKGAYPSAVHKSASVKVVFREQVEQKNVNEIMGKLEALHLSTQALLNEIKS